ncbi:MAG: hypothetical protein H7248_00085 [Microbacteriaceae bacterium]|nr:hypothetical protein [Microbacteriaceae bacterium]
MIESQIDSENIWFLNGGAWFALAVVNAGLAEQKGRGRLVWFLVSLIAGPLATVAIVMRAKVPATPVAKLHPLTVAVDRYIVLACIFLTAALGFFVIALGNGYWAFWTLAGVAFALFTWMTVLFWRAPFDPDYPGRRAPPSRDTEA